MKMGYYCIKCNVMEFGSFWMNKGQDTKIKTRYGLVSVNIKLQKYYLNGNPACLCVSCVNECEFNWLHTYWSAHDTFSASTTSYSKYNVQTATVTATIKIKVRFNLKNLWQKYITECTTTNINTIIVKTLLLRNIYQNNYLPEKINT